MGSASLFVVKMALIPIQVRKKIVQIIGFKVFKSTGSASRFQHKNQFLNICTESRDIGQNVSNLAGLVWKAIFNTFWLISQDLVHIFENRFLRWNRESEPVDLNTMNLIILTIFFSYLYRGQSHFDYKKGSTSHWTSELIIMFLESGKNVEWE